jgi:biotin/methionine sulfoxide reductase
MKITHSSHWGAFTSDVEDGKLVAVHPFEKDDAPSDILQSIPGAIYDQSRISEPMVRAGWLENGPGGSPGGNGDGRGAEPFVPVSWDKALDLIAGELTRVKEAHGPAAIFGGSYGWSSAGRFHHAKTQLQRLLNRNGGFTAQVHSYSIAAGLALLPHILGDIRSLRNTTSWRAIADHTKLFVTFGGLGLKNTQVEPGGAGEHAAGKWLPRLAEAGVDVVSITPLRDDSADILNATWLAPRPNTDTALMMGLAHTLVAKDLHDTDFLARYCVGFDKFEPYLMGEVDGQPKSADWAAGICGIDADTIRALARKMARVRTMIGTAYSLQRGDHGEQPFWMTAVLAAMLGQIGLPGGGFGFGYGSMNGQGNPVEKLSVPSLSAGANHAGSFIPVARIADMLLNPGGGYDFDGESRTYPDIRLVYWCGGNPFHHHQDINRLVAAWRRPETIIVHEPWWTATARHADIVLPATTTLERNDIGASSRDRFIIAMKKAIEPVGQARHDYDIFTDLAARLGVTESFTEGRNEDEWLRHLYDVARQQCAQEKITLPDFDEFWAQGYVETPEPETPHTLYTDFRADPAANPLRTPSGKIEIFCDKIDSFGYDDCPGHPVWLEPSEWLGGATAAKFPLHLMSNQPQTRLHSQMDQGAYSRDSKIQGREPCGLNPLDAAARNITDGDIIRLFNDRGATLAGAVVTEDVRPGVVRLSTGAWYDPEIPGTPGALDKHGNPNMLTPDHGTSKLGQGPVSHTALVEVEKFTGTLPEITIFSPPQTKGPAE